MNGIGIKTSVSQRNYGIDLLRIVAAFYVIILHSLNQGGIYTAVVSDSYQDYLCRLLMIFSICAVNIFGIISGYVGYRDAEKTASLSGYLSIWLSVIFYSVVICVVYLLLLPGIVTGRDLVKMFFPLSQCLYWYFSAYTLVYFISPYLNKLLQLSSKKELITCFWTICCVVVPLEYLGKTFAMSYGYSAIWLIVLYLIGAILKKCEIGKRVPSIVLILGILANNLCYFGLNTRFLNTSIFFFELCFEIDSSYVSPFYLIPAILYVILFSRLSFRPVIRKIITFCASATFYIYIVNVQPQFWQYFMDDRFVTWSNSSPEGLFVRIIAFSFGFVVLVTISDYYRRIFFRLLRIPELLQKLSRTLKST